MQFIHPSLTWGFLLVLIPLAIHLINLVRRRRVQWAAMDFLLQSYRQHRTWIWFQQLLLLLLRMAVVALLVAMLAQWVTQREWFALFGGTATHHFVLVDDSYSMSERSSGTTAFDVAERIFGDIVMQAMRQDTRQKLTVLRFSRVAGLALPSGAADASSEIVDSSFETRLAELRRRLAVTELDRNGGGALRAVKQLVADGEDENNIVYLLSDFRERDWASPAEARLLLEELAELGCDLHLIDCAPQPQANLAITDLQPADDIRAAGVPLFVNITVRNYGDQTVRKVPVQLRTYAFDPQVVAASRPGQDVARQDEPPAVLIDEITPGQSATVRCQVFFPLAGPQAVEAYLPEDAVTTDSRRWCVIDLPAGEPVLVVDGSLHQRHSYHLTAAFAPGQRAATGVQPDAVQPPAFLRAASSETLSGYRAIYLLDVPSLDDRGLQNLVKFVEGGGGVGIFLGENVNLNFYNGRFYDEGRGLFPLPLARTASLPPERFENVPDLEIQEHPIFEPFLGERNPLIQWVRIEQYYRPSRQWSAAPEVRVFAQLRNGDPFAVERRFGAGRVVTFLTTAAPTWNNWANDPSFVVAVLKLHAYLAAASRTSETHLVGSQLAVEMPADAVNANVSFVTPGSEQGDRQVITRSGPPAAESEGAPIRVSLERRAGSEEGPTDRSGIYEAWLQAANGPAEVDRFAVNVDPAEGALGKPEPGLLLERLAPVDVHYHQAGDYAASYMENAGANRSLLLMGLLVGALLSEQVLAYFTSFHPRRAGAA